MRIEFRSHKFQEGNIRSVWHLEKCGLFSNFKYGFRSSQSTEDILIVVSDRIARAFDRSGAAQAVALDISKVFDRVWHSNLLHQLKPYRISGKIFGLISSFQVIESFKSFWIGSFHKNVQLTLEFQAFQWIFCTQEW